MSAPMDHIEVLACRKLWQAVLLDQLTLLLTGHDPISGTNKKIQLRIAADWFGSRDFGQVCVFAGFDPAYVAARVRRELALPLPQRVLAQRARFSRGVRFGGRA
jgi:hypothetical protein